MKQKTENLKLGPIGYHKSFNISRVLNTSWGSAQTALIKARLWIKPSLKCRPGLTVKYGWAFNTPLKDDPSIHEISLTEKHNLTTMSLMSIYSVISKTHCYIKPEVWPICSVLFFSRPWSKVWPHHGFTFSIYLCPLSCWLTLPQRVLSTSWCCPSRPCVVFLACMHLALYLALSLSPGNSLVSSYHANFLALTVSNNLLFTPALLRTDSFVFFTVHETCRVMWPILVRQTPEIWPMIGLYKDLQ